MDSIATKTLEPEQLVAEIPSRSCLELVLDWKFDFLMTEIVRPEDLLDCWDVAKPKDLSRLVAEHYFRAVLVGLVDRFADFAAFENWIAQKGEAYCFGNGSIWLLDSEAD